MEQLSAPLTYETIEVGQRFVSQGRTITEADHGLFTMLSGDWHPIHSDEEFAKTTPLGRRMVHGIFGVVLAISLHNRLLNFADPLVAALGLPEWSYKAPLFIGDTVHVEMEIAAKRLTSKGDRYVVERLIRLVNQHGAVVQEGRASSMWAREI
jgi:acyl dehydratase